MEFQLPFSKVILGSASPRRKELLQQLGLDFEVIGASVDEVYPDSLKHYLITDYLASLKADSLINLLDGDTLLITADTIVWHNESVLEKPADLKEARQTLEQLSGSWHEVITSVCFRSLKDNYLVHDVTEVHFGRLDTEMISAYFEKGNPLDKAGAYGIQEWLGLVGITEIKGSYTNVVGLPTALVYNTLRRMAGRSD
ncbi:Maf family nucleotide pyrophosphatase [Robiginitalea sp. IMCC43444]|uniref:Maf family nucleotide pyrophosphatase n=1 Tax=Robiginitalea sp. IMCC43444 TaxID=3459121 RepID=UPI0040410E38